MATPEEDLRDLARAWAEKTFSVLLSVAQVNDLLDQTGLWTTALKDSTPGLFPLQRVRRLRDGKEGFITGQMSYRTDDGGRKTTAIMTFEDGTPASAEDGVDFTKI